MKLCKLDGLGPQLTDRATRQALSRPQRQRLDDTLANTKNVPRSTVGGIAMSAIERCDQRFQRACDTCAAAVADTAVARVTSGPRCVDRYL